MSDTSQKTGSSAKNELPESRGSAGRVARLAAKELREILRDRRTIITLILMPLLVYPLLSILFQRFVITRGTEQGPPVYIIGVESTRDELIVINYLSAGRRLLAVEDAESPQQENPGVKLPIIGEPKELPLAEVKVVQDLQERVEDDEVDIGIRVQTRTDLPAFVVAQPDPARQPELLPPVILELIHTRTSLVSQRALRFTERCLESVNDEYLSKAFRHVGVPVGVAASHKRTAVAGTDRTTVSLTTLFPLILILMTITGAVYPAIDLTAGERERNTMETLIAAPVPRLALLLGKYVAVMTVALLTATANVIAMSITLLSTGLGTLLFGDQGLSLPTVVQVFALMILFAAFFSAVLLALTSFARSFKEAQAYLIPVMLVAIAPGLLSLMPNVELRGPLVIVPLVNIVLLGRDMFEGSAEFGSAIIVVISTALYALAAIALAARIFGTDAILYGSSGSWRDFFRRGSQRRSAVTPTGAMLCLGVMFPMYYLLASIVARQQATSIPFKLFQTTLISVLLFAAIPFLATSWSNVPFRSGFRVNMTKPLAFVAAGLLGLVLWPFAHEIVLLSHNLGIAVLKNDLLQSAKDVVERLQATGSPILILATLAVAPAVLEELFFRGFLFSALRTRTSAGLTILFSAILFGAFHIVASHGLAIERFFPSTFMGLILGWICYRSGSVLPGMLLHACHNGLLLMLALYAYHHDGKQIMGWGMEDRAHLPWTWLLGAAAGVALGVALLAFVTQRKKPQISEAHSTT